MVTVNFRMSAVLRALVMFGLLAIVSAPVMAQESAVDPAATQTLKRMIDYVAGLKQFSVHTQNTLEDILDTGQRIDVDVSTKVVVSRPDKLRAERIGDVFDQVFYYNGKTLTLFNPSDNVYATESAPATIEEMLDYIRESLGLLIPASDLIYRNSFPLLMQDVTSAMVVGKSMINGVRCDHLAFSRPGVDFQVWVADAGQPLPCKYVVTDTSTPERVSVTSVMSDWNVEPDASPDSFNFVPPQGAMGITFLPLDAGSGSSN